MNEKKKMWMHRTIWLVLTVLVILLPIIISAAKPKLELLDSECNTYYDGYTDTTDYEITLYFNRDVNSGYALINFFDSGHNFIDSENEYFLSDGKEATNIYSFINGEATYYEIVSYDFKPSNKVFYTYCLLMITIPMLICALLISYKECYIDGKPITVYAGFYHHTLRIDGELCDEHNTIFSFTPIKLSTTIKDGTKIEATISLTNRIAIKVNDKLCKK